MRPRFHSWVAKFPWRRDRLPTPVFLGFSGGSDGKESTYNVGDPGSIPGLGRSLEEGMATHSSILAWRLSMDRGAWQAADHGGHRVRHDWATKHSTHCKSQWKRASLVIQWLTICLPMRGTRVRSLVREDPTCCGAAKPMCCNYWVQESQLLKPECLEPVLWNKRSHCNENPAHCNEGVSTACRN